MFKLRTLALQAAATARRVRGRTDRARGPAPVRRPALWPALLPAVLWAAGAQAQTGIVVIANPSVPKTDLQSVQRIYTGRQIEVAGVAVVPVNLPGGAPAREQFLASVLNQDDEKYRAYWTVRRYIGKGAPPRELTTAAEIISFVQATPGAIGYVDASELKPGTAVTILK